MKNMKRVLFYIGMGSCVSNSTKSVEQPTKLSDDHKHDHDQDHDHHTLEKVLNSVQSPVWEPSGGSKEEAFYDSKPWLESDDESDFFSVNGDIPPYKKTSNNGDQQGRKLSELFKESSSFSSESQTSVIAAKEAKEKEDQIITTLFSPSINNNNNNNNNLERKKSSKSVKQHCLPSLVRSLSCGDRNKKRSSPSHMAVVAG